jgi:hypothetical protein
LPRHEGGGCNEKPPLIKHALGWAFHYVIGIAYGLLLVAIWGAEWLRQPGIAEPLILALALLVLPYFVTARAATLTPVEKALVRRILKPPDDPRVDLLPVFSLERGVLRLACPSCTWSYANRSKSLTTV